MRINSRGTPVSAADRAFARAPLRQKVKGLLKGLKLGFSALPAETILLTVALAFDAKDVGARAIQSMVEDIENQQKGATSAKIEFDSAWLNLKTAIEKSVDFLTGDERIRVINYQQPQNFTLPPLVI